MVSKVILVCQHIRVNSAILEFLLRKILLVVARFINAYHFINSYQRLKRLDKAFVTFDDIYSLAYLLSKDVAQEIADENLWNFSWL